MYVRIGPAALDERKIIRAFMYIQSDNLTCFMTRSPPVGRWNKELMKGEIEYASFHNVSRDSGADVKKPANSDIGGLLSSRRRRNINTYTRGNGEPSII